jgi:hypothetical protein
MAHSHLMANMQHVVYQHNEHNQITGILIAEKEGESYG